MKKRLCAILLALTMSFSLTACGGVDTQPAIDAFNNASTAYDAVANKINAEPEVYPEELIASMNERADAMLEYKELLESDAELTEEQVAEMIQVFTEVETWSKDTDAKLEEFRTLGADKQPAIDAFTKTSEAFNRVAEAINADVDSYPAELIDAMNQMADTLTECDELLSGETMLTEDAVQELVQQLADIEAWVISVDEEILGNLSLSAGDDMDMSAAITYFNSISTDFDATASVVNANPDAFSQDLIDTMLELADTLITYKELLESNYAFTEDEYNMMLQDLMTIEQWLSDAEEDIFG